MVPAVNKKRKTIEAQSMKIMIYIKNQYLNVIKDI
jgi:hypothetical protein